MRITVTPGMRFKLNASSGNPGRTGFVLYESNTDPDSVLVRFDGFAYNSLTKTSYLVQLPDIDFQLGKSMSARDLAAKLHSANSRVVTANDPTTSPVSRWDNLRDASALLKEVIGALMEGETDYYGNRVPTA